MIFSAFIDKTDGSGAWRAAMALHAHWLSLTPYLETRKTEAGHTVHFGWLAPQRREHPATYSELPTSLLLTTTGVPPAAPNWTGLPQADGEIVRQNHVEIRIALDSGEMGVTVPPTTPEPIYFADDGAGFIVANDLRLFVHWFGLDVDAAAIYALWQYEAIPAPFSFLPQVRRVPNGHQLTLTPEPHASALTVAFQPSVKPEREDRAAALEQVSASLKGLLATAPPASVLYFSGGVDSALMAAEFAELGRRDVILFNYAFGPQDSESQLARQIAAHLGLPWAQVDYQPAHLFEMVTRIGADYSFPFGDRSVIPTNLLVHASLATIAPGATVIDGTGADGAWGAWSVTTPLAHVPRWLRQAMGFLYRRLQLWQSASSFEERLRHARQSLHMTQAHYAVIGDNSLDGIAYHIPPATRAALASAVAERIEALGAQLDREGQYSWLDLVHVCAGRFAAKTFDPLRLRGIEPIYPFLEPSIVDLSLSLPYATKVFQNQSKALLKQLLARTLPENWIYRPKSGFVPPFAAMLQSPLLREFIGDIVLSPHNVLLPFVDEAMLRRMFAATSREQRLSNAAYSFLWTFIFSTAWFDQVGTYARPDNRIQSAPAFEPARAEPTSNRNAGVESEVVEGSAPV